MHSLGLGTRLTSSLLKIGNADLLAEACVGPDALVRVAEQSSAGFKSRQALPTEIGFGGALCPSLPGADGTNFSPGADVAVMRPPT